MFLYVVDDVHAVAGNADLSLRVNFTSNGMAGAAAQGRNHPPAGSQHTMTVEVFHVCWSDGDFFSSSILARLSFSFVREQRVRRGKSCFSLLWS